ncbi:MAG: hypothetical protein J2P57_00325 [Acidimicrobiaceae bacterium]|nr:hypothetical protein [Acidimicrobiaceae bacterium]
MTTTLGHQPYLHDLHAAINAPSQAWTASDGDVYPGTGAQGWYHSDVRVLSGLIVTLDDQRPVALAAGSDGPDRTEFVAVAPSIDLPDPDPKVRVHRSLQVHPGEVSLEITLMNGNDQHRAGTLCVEVQSDLATMDDVKNGLCPEALAPGITQSAGKVRVQWTRHGTEAILLADGASVDPSADATVRLVWPVELQPHADQSITLRMRAHDSQAVVMAHDQVPWTTPKISCDDERITRLVTRSLEDLSSLVMTSPSSPGNCFLAAGAPWYFTLFGRDSLWAARMMLPLGTTLAEGTLKTLAALQGTANVVATAEQPGKIPHEVRRETLRLDETSRLPPIYYGTIDATPLWICLLHDAWVWGMPEDSVRSLLPAMKAALSWMREYGDADGDGLLEYIDQTGTGLANQGWKDSHDSVQFVDGTLAAGPIALVEVQAYAYEAAIKGAQLLDAFDGAGTGDPWRAWACRLRERFHACFWTDDELGPYLGIALDGEKRLVDTVTSNMGHVLGTGMLSSEQSGIVAHRLVHETMSSGLGLRTMSTRSAGYWPLKYHGGSVWPHDTAIAIRGLAAEGHHDAAADLIGGVLRAACHFDYRLPELYSGDDCSRIDSGVPYPASCRPQAWSAASAIAILEALTFPIPDRATSSIRPRPGRSTVFGSVQVDGFVVGRDCSPTGPRTHGGEAGTGTSAARCR